MLDLQRLEQVKLTLSRLNDMWSFTGRKLSWRVDAILRPMPYSDLYQLLQGVTAYGCLAALAGEAKEYYGNPPDEWTRLFNYIGSELLFDLPSGLSLTDQRAFEKAYSKSFMQGYKTATLSPSPLSP